MQGHRTRSSCRNFLIPKEFQGCIFGKDGYTIKGIQITTNTTIAIRDTKDPTKSTVRILGTANGTREAEKRVRHVLEEHIGHVERRKEILKLNMWKTSLGFKTGCNIVLKVCDKFLRGKCDLTEIECSFTHPDAGNKISSGFIIICNDYLIDYCKNAMVDCRYAHRPKSFIETKLKTRVEAFQLEGQEKEDCSTQTLNKSTQTSDFEDSSRIVALEKRILHLERTLRAKESMIDEFLADPVQFI